MDVDVPNQFLNSELVFLILHPNICRPLVLQLRTAIGQGLAEDFSIIPTLVTKSNQYNDTLAVGGTQIERPTILAER